MFTFVQGYPDRGKSRVPVNISTPGPLKPLNSGEEARHRESHKKMVATSGARVPQRGRPLVVRTIDLFKHPKPVAHADLSYTMSHPAPVEDPCAYAAGFLRGPSHAKMVFRLTKPLDPTFEETQANMYTHSPSRTTRGDPAFALAESDNLDNFVDSMIVGGMPVSQYQARQASRTVPAAAMAPPDTTLITPQKRAMGAQLTSTAKRQRTVRVSSNGDGDVSMDTVQSVLRMIDDSLVDTPERKPVATPRVLRAAPGPSPRQNGPTYAYDSQSQLDGFGGLAPRPSTAQAPWLGQRIMRI